MVQVATQFLCFQSLSKLNFQILPVCFREIEAHSFGHIIKRQKHTPLCLNKQAFIELKNETEVFVVVSHAVFLKYQSTLKPIKEIQPFVFGTDV